VLYSPNACDADSMFLSTPCHAFPTSSSVFSWSHAEHCLLPTFVPSISHSSTLHSNSPPSIPHAFSPSPSFFCSGIKLLAAESARTTCPCTCPTRNCGSKIPTMLSSRHAVSLGCAPTPTQYRAREMSSRMSFHGRPCVSPGRGAWGFGS
jgi:hypothetical protein